MKRHLSRSVLAVVLVLTTLCTSFAYAQDKRGTERRGVERREIQRERFHTDHWVFDDRFHHNHYYPQHGYAVPALPAGHLALRFRGEPFFFHSGVWYRRAGPSFVVIRPPVGIVVPVLPPSYSTVLVAGAPYYYANDVYYEQTPQGYAVVSPPADMAEAPPSPQVGAPGAASPSSASGNWYYCESAKTYYPYVSECREGWRTVPASPPPAR